MCKDNHNFREIPTILWGKSPQGDKSLPYICNVNKFK